MKRIYIAGCGGMLGEAFYHQFRDGYDLMCTDKDVNEPWIKYRDFRHFDAYRDDVVKFKADYLFHLGAFTDLEYCEDHAKETYFNNTLAVENAVLIANSLNIPILYISTAGIFDGNKSEYDDWDQPNPLSVYGRSKYMGERYVIENAQRYLVLRAGWMMGGGPGKDKKFVQKIMEQVKNGANELFVVNDKSGTPTYTHDFAKTARGLLEKEYWGLYNCVCSGSSSRYEVAQVLMSITGKKDLVDLCKVNSDYFKSTYFACRPNSEMLRTSKLDLRQMNQMRDWKVSLTEYIRNYYHGYLS